MITRTTPIFLVVLCVHLTVLSQTNNSKLTLTNGNNELPSYFKIDTEDGNNQAELLNTTTESSDDKHTIFRIVNKRSSGASNNGGASLLLLDYDYSINSNSGVNKSTLAFRNDDLDNAFISFWSYNTATYSPFNESRLLDVNSSKSMVRMNLSSTHATKMKWEFDGIEKMRITNTGQLSVNANNIPTQLGEKNLSDYKLFVNGGVLAKEVLVKTDWADYVFDSSYTLLPIKKVKEYIEINKHLPNVPSSKDIENNGLPLGEITKIQQEKIEELFLYIIEQDKEIKKLQLQNKNLGLIVEKVNKLEKKVMSLTN